MSTILRVGQPCPLHKGSRYCACHGSNVKDSEGKRYRFGKRKYESFEPGVQRIPDETHPRGYREKASPAAKRRRKDQMLRSYPYCAGCAKQFTAYSDVEFAHKESKGSGGFKADDHRDNTTLMCVVCNREQGSRTLDQYLEWRREKGLPTP